ncbi:MAG: hypothetical protein KH275_03010 [Clostridiales bacterium]|nr:hypothetical protein [Clostridiales bacterium]
MINRYYRIADVNIKVCMEQEFEIPMFREFEAEESEENQITVEMYQSAGIFQKWYGIEYCYTEPECPHIFASKTYPRIRMKAWKDWTRFVIEGCSYGIDGVMELFLAGFYSYLSFSGGILSHASVVRWRGEAVIFTAASGIGKTTQAELWKKYRGAEILNGDKVILICREEVCTAWGTPWKGSSPYSENNKAPLRAIVVLEQAKKNAIRRIEGTEAMSRLTPHLFYPLWDKDCVGAAMVSLDLLLRQTPVYLLSCLPDQEAVEMTCHVIWGDA